MTHPGREVPRLIVITDLGVATESELESRIGAVLVAARPRTVMVQLRDNELPAKRRLAWGRRLMDACRRRDHWFVVNDRLDIAAVLGADGVHLGEAGVSAADARTVLAADAWISRACHDPAAVMESGVDAVLLSPVAAARKGRPALGVDALRRAREGIEARAAVAPLALYALGGVDARNAAQCLSAGADGVAVIGAVADGRDVRPLLEAIGILAP